MGLIQTKNNIKSYEDISKACEGVKTLKPVNPKELDEWDKNAKRAQMDAEKVVSITRQTSSRPLLHDKVFPQLKEKSSAFIYFTELSENYCNQINSLIRNLHGGDRPTKMEEDNVIQDYEKRSGKVSTGFGAFPGMMPMGPGVGLAGQEETPQERLIDDLRNSKAESISIYANPESFCCYDFWKSNPEDSLNVMLEFSWFSQIALWIQEDVVLSINQLNDTSVSVLYNPIKRLVEISFGGESIYGATGGTTTSATQLQIVERRRSGSQDMLPVYVTESDTDSSSGQVMAAVDSSERYPGSMTATFNKHVSNDLIDVVHFEVAVIIDTTRIIDFINALQSIKEPEGPNKRNQITVLDMQVEPVNILDEKEGGYRYGMGSLGALRLICEYVFFKDGYEQYKPASVKKMLEGSSERRPSAPGKSGADKKEKAVEEDLPY
ncbi:MAG: hypothetical protein JW860_03770 [Sedimentisphaerales bacterium]|nr:hypothetical protein [Sedimentisphaerales bacterium]